MDNKLDGAKQGARQATQEVRKAVNQPWYHWLARSGFAARGVVYVIIGGLAAFAALGRGGGTTDRNGAIQTIYRQPFGQFLLLLVGIGLVGYAAWKFAAAAFDTEDKGNRPKGWAKRAGYVAIGVSYLGLATTAVQLALAGQSNSPSSDQTAQDWTARLLEQPFGVALVVIAGLVVIGLAGGQFYQAYTAKFKQRLDLSTLDRSKEKLVEGLARFGLTTRGIVFGLVGVFLIIAALTHDPGNAKGLGGTLDELSRQAYGQVLLGVVAFGLVAYGVYSFFEARYHRLGQA